MSDACNFRRFSLPFSNTKAAPPIQKVAIIGSGICGLSLAHTLENSEKCAKQYLDSIDGGSRDEDGPGMIGIEAHFFMRENL